LFGKRGYGHIRQWEDEETEEIFQDLVDDEPEFIFHGANTKISAFGFSNWENFTFCFLFWISVFSTTWVWESCWIF